MYGQWYMDVHGGIKVIARQAMRRDSDEDRNDRTQCCCATMTSVINNPNANISNQHPDQHHPQPQLTLPLRLWLLLPLPRMPPPILLLHLPRIQHRLLQPRRVLYRRRQPPLSLDLAHALFVGPLFAELAAVLDGLAFAGVEGAEFGGGVGFPDSTSPYA